MFESLRYKHDLARKVKSKIVRDVQDPKVRLVNLVTQSNMYGILVKNIVREQSVAKASRLQQDEMVVVSGRIQSLGNEGASSVFGGRIRQGFNEMYHSCTNSSSEEEDSENEYSSSEPDSTGNSDSCSDSDSDSNSDSDSDCQGYDSDEHENRLISSPSYVKSMGQYILTEYHSPAPPAWPIIESIEIISDGSYDVAYDSASDSDSDRDSDSGPEYAQPYWCIPVEIRNSSLPSTCGSHFLPVIFEEHESSEDSYILLED
ncbi:hypothetical protein CLIB1423_38S00606 [[Candida] railenensis]|uniref:Uncharacterized protein n=1 Tax=[Candida] railenensis TaxID=45579 RepID=A0A9P0W1E4_9ASCO|nr:hypothetical protein CLIB1423_38S00606 [[Candida] railenensis]